MSTTTPSTRSARPAARGIIALAAAGLIALLALAAAPAAQAAGGVQYRAKGSGGYDVTFRFAGGKIRDFATGVPMTCLAIQGGGSPISGAEPVRYGWMRVPLKDYRRSDLVKPAFHYNEVTMNQTISTRRARNGTISGAIRIQYSFLIPRYPPGTFGIYSCLGTTKFKARPVG
jgi:hypothetical protein